MASEAMTKQSCTFTQIQFYEATTFIFVNCDNLNTKFNPMPFKDVNF